jgi:hypothetical protein
MNRIVVYRSSERGFLGTQDYAVYPNDKSRKRNFGPEATECRTVLSRKLRKKRKGRSDMM